ncbi:hypothetical protein EDEG_02357 [Edhazardia aedis USNM 41457]|uniref:Uncharacterized protein n=1 Tax=Edhazardia aedis (strain USNM 41457) TaxID=1003232 RepID=J9D670_EDHAE|nr:hypothetical protein EDEG_02357 [Edhazardia aedis USNM 41457]|eukprot:EJW03291.1 hypothetical protein EDEG_02357 [Edhazardia aedis USNM 41457]
MFNMQKTIPRERASKRTEKDRKYVHIVDVTKIKNNIDKLNHKEKIIIKKNCNNVQIKSNSKNKLQNCKIQKTHEKRTNNNIYRSCILNILKNLINSNRGFLKLLLATILAILVLIVTIEVETLLIPAKIYLIFQKIIAEFRYTAYITFLVFFWYKSYHKKSLYSGNTSNTKYMFESFTNSYDKMIPCESNEQSRDLVLIGGIKPSNKYIIIIKNALQICRNKIINNIISKFLFKHYMSAEKIWKTKIFNKKMIIIYFWIINMIFIQSSFAECDIITYKNSTEHNKKINNSNLLCENSKKSTYSKDKGNLDIKEQNNNNLYKSSYLNQENCLDQDVNENEEIIFNFEYFYNSILALIMAQTQIKMLRSKKKLSITYKNGMLYIFEALFEEITMEIKTLTIDIWKKMTILITCIMVFKKICYRRSKYIDLLGFLLNWHVAKLVIVSIMINFYWCIIYYLCINSIRKIFEIL